MSNTKRQTGLWMDSRHCYLVHLNGEEVLQKVINSNLDEGKPKGGSRAKSPWGPMDTVSESKHLAKRKAQLKHYFTEIADELKGSKSLLALGAGGTRDHFCHYLSEDSDLTFSKIISQKSDKMTANQLVAKVKSTLNESQ